MEFNLVEELAEAIKEARDKATYFLSWEETAEAVIPIISTWLDSVENPYKKRADKDFVSGYLHSKAMYKEGAFNEAMAALKAALREE